jgi:hypothetical protein
MKKNYKRLYKRIEKLATTSNKYGVEYYFLSFRPVNEKQMEKKKDANISPDLFINDVASAIVDIAADGGVNVGIVLDMLASKVLSRAAEDKNADK